MGGLHHEYVRRVVDTLANFEDELIATNGFFAREEHFESCIDGVRAEFEVDRRAIAIFAAPDTLSDLISTLCDAEAEALSQRGESKERRRFENAFAASVLLSSSIGVRGLLRNPPLLQQMWQFVERPAHHPVLLHYWHRTAKCFLLQKDTSDGLSRSIAALGLRRVLVPLVPLIHCDAMHELLKAIIGVGAPASEVTDGRCVGLRLALTGEQSVVPSLLRLMHDGHAAAQNAADFLEGILETITGVHDGAVHFMLIMHAYLPGLPQVLAHGAGATTRQREAQLAFLKLAAAALAAEQACRAEDLEQRSCLPAALLGSPDGSPRNAFIEGRPVCSVVARHLAALAPLMSHADAPVAQAAVRLWRAFLKVAPPELVGTQASCQLAQTAVGLYTATDRNGGGRQDFLRHQLLKALAAALSADDANLSRALLRSAKLVDMLDVNLAMRQGAGGKASRCSPEHATQLLLEVAASARLPTVAPHLSRSTAWRRVCGFAGVDVGDIPQCAPDWEEGDLQRLSLEPVPTAGTPEAAHGADGAVGADGAAPEGGEEGGEGAELSGQADAENVNPNKTPPEVAAPSPPKPRSGTPPRELLEMLPSNLVVDCNSLRNPDDFSKLTPRPTFERRSILHRKAKESSPFFRSGKKASPIPKAIEDADAVIRALNETVKALHF